VGCFVSGIGEKDPFAQAGGMAVDKGIDCLEAEVGHARPVDVRVGEADRQCIAPDLPDVSLFPGEDIEASFFQLP
jgi:hypothetical protein